MIKVGDTVRYVGPITSYMGLTGGEVISIKYGKHPHELEVALVKWPSRTHSEVSHSVSALMVTSQAQDTQSKPPVADDGVRQPSYYQVFPGLESIEVIARSMTEAEFRGFCMGNTLKYRMRAGKKSDLASIEKDLAKADFYKELFDQHKGKCYAAK